MNSKRKGNRFELFISKWLTKWSGFKFQRAPYSGANHFNRELASDIMCSDPKHQHRCRISVECKSYKDIKFEHILLGNKGCDILKFWDQASKDAKRAHKIPILCMRYNSMPKEDFFFVISSDFSDLFEPILQKPFFFINLGNKEEDSIMVFMASQVIKNIKYQDLHKLAKLKLK